MIPSSILSQQSWRKLSSLLNILSSNGRYHRFAFSNLSSLNYDRATLDDGNNYRFVDQVKITVSGGKGGDGCISYESLSPGKKRPSGGTGGRGGNVFVIADKSKATLRFPTVHFSGEDGKPGGGSGMSGRTGSSVSIKVPCGTIVSEVLDEYSLEYPPDEEESCSADHLLDEPRKVELNNHGDMLLVARGGKAGLGNKATSSGNRKNQAIPGTKTPGQLGQHRTLFLELKTIADVGLVGYPNAGKSSLLRALSNATPKVAAYPFTTLYPTVGIVEYSDLYQLSVADIPGLIEGAHQDRGLGHDFLKHIERTKILLFVVDIHTQEMDRKLMTPVMVLEELMNEIELYEPLLLKRPMILFANKYDLADVNDEQWKNNEEELRRFAEQRKILIFNGSALKGDGISQLAHQLRLLVQDLQQPPLPR